MTGHNQSFFHIVGRFKKRNMTEGNQSIVKKNQHYVPQRYLRKFAEHFNIFDKVKQELRNNQNVKNYASERFFYDVDFQELLEEAKLEGYSIDPDIEKLSKIVDKQDLENVFANKVETIMFDPFDHIIASYILTPKTAYANKNVIPEEMKATIAYYLSIQFVRTKEYREKIIQMYEKGTKLFLKKGLGDEFDPAFLNNIEIKLKKNKINLIHNQHLLDTEMLEELSMALLSHIWFVAVNETEESFYTSDNPLVLYGHKEQQGLKSEGIEIVFPINPKIAIVMREVKYFNDDLVKYNKFVTVTKKYVEFCNSLQVVQSYRYIFSKNDKFSLASKILEDNPELSDLNKDRFLMG